MRIPSGKTDQSIYFVALDATDYVTREVGLSGFTVQRSRNGAAETAYTTPTVVEIDATNMPGVYALLIDEDTTIAASSDSEEYCVHITQASMAPVTRTIELYRRDITTGETLTVTSSALGANTVTATSIATGAITAAKFAASAIDATAIAANAITSAKIATDAIGAAQIAANAIGASEIATGAITAAKFAAGAIDAAAIAADAIGSSELAQTAVDKIADQIWDEVLSGHAGVGSTGAALSAAGGSGDPWSTALPGAYGAGTAGNIVGTNLDATVSSRATVAALSTLQTDVNAISARVPTALISGRMDSSVGSMAANTLTASALATDAVTEITNGILAGQITELAGVPIASPSLASALALLYMAVRNKRDTTSSADEIHNDAGAVIATAVISDDGSTFTKSEYT